MYACAHMCTYVRRILFNVSLVRRRLHLVFMCMLTGNCSSVCVFTEETVAVETAQ